MLLYGGTLSGCALAFNLIWRHAARARLLAPGLTSAFLRDVNTRYLLGLLAYLAATLLALIQPLLTVIVSVALALLFALGPSPRPTFAATVDDTRNDPEDWE